MSKVFKILYAEDNELEGDLFKRAGDKIDFDLDVLHVANGEEALNVILELEEKGERFDLVFLDLNMPKMGGFEVLENLASEKIIVKNLIYVLSSSENQRDIKMAYELGCLGYIIKPKTVADNAQMIESALKFSQFLSTVK